MKETPRATPQASAKPTSGAAGQATGQATDGDVVVIHDNRNEHLEQELAKQRRGVGDAEGVRKGAQEKQVEGARPAVHPRGGHRR